MAIEEFKLLILHRKIYSHLMETNISWLRRLADIWCMRQHRWRAAATIYIALCIFLFKYGSFASFLEFLATHATALTVTVILDSYDHFSTVKTIAPGQLRSYRRCRVCTLRSYCENFTRPYFGNNCTHQQRMARKIETDDAAVLCTYTRVQICVQASQSVNIWTHCRRRPTSCMVVTAMIVTVSPQWIRRSRDGLLCNMGILYWQDEIFILWRPPDDAYTRE